MAGRTAGQVTDQEAGSAAERAARESYGRLVALLAASTRDIALAEDALADAFERALRTWPTTGVPDNPPGWLMTVARNRIRDVLASAAARTAAPLDDHVAATLAEPDPDAIPDKRLELLFACAHPAINPAVRTPLMLQVVLGFDVGPHRSRVRGASPPRWHSAWSGPSDASATPASRSGPRRVRTCPLGCRRCSKPSTAPMRSTGSTSTSESANPSPTRHGGSPCSPQACSTPNPRRGASPRCSPSRSHGHPPARTRPGRPSTSRTPRLWDRSLIAEGEALLRRAHALGAPLGRFQLEAAIQSAHCDRARTGTLDRATIVQLYRGLVAIAPTSGAVEALATLTA